MNEPRATVYLDHAATTPMYPEVVAAMMRRLTRTYPRAANALLAMGFAEEEPPKLPAGLARAHFPRTPPSTYPSKPWVPDKHDEHEPEK